MNGRLKKLPPFHPSTHPFPPNSLLLVNASALAQFLVSPQNSLGSQFIIQSVPLSSVAYMTHSRYGISNQKAVGLIG